MGRAHSTTLIFPRGIPLPPGNPGHSGIVPEDGGERSGAAQRPATVEAAAAGMHGAGSGAMLHALGDRSCSA